MAPVAPIDMGQENVKNTQRSFRDQSKGLSGKPQIKPFGERLFDSTPISSGGSLRPSSAASRRPLVSTTHKDGLFSHQKSNSSVPKSQPKQSMRSSLLRYGEHMENLFGIAGQQVSQSYFDDCNMLVETQCNSPLVWKRVLDYATRNQILTESELVKLHRRATTRLVAPSECNDEVEFESLVLIWLSYAKALARYGSEQEARSTLQHVKSWAPHKAAVFLHLAAMERENPTEAISILQQGIENQAHPMEDLEREVEKLIPKRKAAVSPKRKLPLEPTLSPKRLKTESGKIFMPSTAASATEVKLSNHQSTSRKESIRFRLEPLPWQQNNDVTAERNKSRMSEGSKTPASVTQHSLDISDSSKHAENLTPIALSQASQKNDNNSATKPQAPSGRSTPARGSTELSTTRLKSTGSKARRPPLLAKTRFSGKAQRVDPTVNQYVDSEEEGEAEDLTGNTKMTVPKLDLSYILEWDPSKRFSQNDENKSQLPEKSKSPEKVKASPQLPKIEESHAFAPPKQASTPEFRKPIARDENQSAASRQTEATKENESEKLERPKDKESREPDHHKRLREQANPEFLPMISEKNTIRVNATPYIKLGGAVGKGGSCKVYRALTKDYAVVAIKKVKLAGMDKRHIESYANEISLLKSLKNCSPIIQLFDSEVDLHRKAIFLVMELGEADLSHVLQKQALAAEGEGKRQLNMNFVRLTWQQMLSAVHCIHEARIIHGDLKPANFLFVKGTLKLIDFGIAKAIENQDTTNIYRESQIGTLNYMSPEAILDSGMGGDKPTMKIGRASDIWSLGCILYQMVYGKTPFADLHMIQKLQAIVNPNHKIRFLDTIDPLAMDAIKQCLQRKPELRPPIVGVGGLLNEHLFLNQRQLPSNK